MPLTVSLSLGIIHYKYKFSLYFLSVSQTDNKGNLELANTTEVNKTYP